MRLSGPGTVSRDAYYLYADICSIASSAAGTAIALFFAETTRAVCQQLCSETYDIDCSGLLYMRDNRSCTLTSYTGEWIPSSSVGSERETCSGREFYRRIRYLGSLIVGPLTLTNS